MNLENCVSKTWCCILLPMCGSPPMIMFVAVAGFYDLSMITVIGRERVVYGSMYRD